MGRWQLAALRCLQAYDTFGNAADTNALKVIIEPYPRSGDFMKVLFPIDGSEFAMAALAKFASMVSLFREHKELVLVNVQLPLPHPRALALVGKEVVAKYYEVQSEEELVGARERLEQRGLAFRVEKRIGDPAQEIVTLAVSEQCDVIAMGTSGRTALKNLVMGSVATKVLAASSVPVLFLK